MSVKNFARLAWQSGMELALRFRMEKSGGKVAKVMYAGAVPESGAKASGGAVKLGYLASKYPECGTSGNILYLVSSSLPRSALAWARQAKARGIAVVLNQNGVAYPAWASVEEQERVNGKFGELASLADHVVFQSEFCRKSFSKWVGVAPRSDSIIYNPVDLSRFRAGPGQKKEFDILLMGSVSQPERVRLALEVLALAHTRGLPWKACIAGKLHWPNAADDFASWLCDLGLVKHVTWRGAYSQEEAADFYAKAKVLLHLQDKDASPTVPLEAMACGVPVVAPRSGGLPELITEKTGILLDVGASWEKFEYPSAETTLAAVSKCLYRHLEMSTDCRKLVEEKFSLDNFVMRHDALFKKLLVEKSGKNSG